MTSFRIRLIVFLRIFLALEGAQLSYVCRRQKIDLQENFNLQNAFKKTLYSDEAVPSECDYNDGALACVYDYTSISTEIEDICVKEGGRFLSTGFGTACGGDGDQIQVYYYNYPFCLGVTCEHEDISSMINDKVIEVDKSLSAQGFLCDDGKTSEDTNSSATRCFYFAASFVSCLLCTISLYMMHQ